jgi:hypothetical protein
MENSQLVKLRKGCSDRVDDGLSVGLVVALVQRSPGPTEEQKVLKNTAVIVIREDQLYPAEAYRDVLPLDGPDSIIHVVLVPQQGKIEALHAFGNERVAVGR